MGKQIGNYYNFLFFFLQLVIRGCPSITQSLIVLQLFRKRTEWRLFGYPPPIHHPTYCSVESYFYCYVETFETEFTICVDRGANPDITSNRAAFSPLDQKVLIHYYYKMFDRANW